MENAVPGVAYEAGAEEMNTNEEGEDLLGKFNPGLGAQSFGGPAKFEALVQAGQFRSPLRRDVIGKGFPDSTVAFLNVKCSRDYPPRILAPDNTEIMDQTLIYPGGIVRVSLRIYAYGGPGTQYPAGISFA